MSKNTICPFCNNIFDGRENRFNDFAKVKREYKWWPLGFYPAMIEFEKYQIVECPNCKKTFTDKNLKLFKIFTPIQIVAISIMIALILISYSLLSI
jgi:hypothetical protein